MKRLLCMGLAILMIAFAASCGKAETVSSTTSAVESTVVSEQPEAAMPTVKQFLQAALEPVGQCLYVYGGGWNEADTGAGEETLQKGVSPGWKEFYDANDASYDYETTRYQIHDGLDCTGHIGYSVYQMFEKKYADDGYVFTSGTMLGEYQRLFGGTVTPASAIIDYRPGDIMGKKGHAFIVLGRCEDGSLLFCHASPPVVSLCGTPASDGTENSEAVRLASEYMKTYFPDSYEKFDSCHRGAEFMTEYDQYRWDPQVLADPDGYASKTPQEILQDLFD